MIIYINSRQDIYYKWQLYNFVGIHHSRYNLKQGEDETHTQGCLCQWGLNEDGTQVSIQGSELFENLQDSQQIEQIDRIQFLEYKKTSLQTFRAVEMNGSSYSDRDVISHRITYPDSTSSKTYPFTSKKVGETRHETADFFRLYSYSN